MRLRLLLELTCVILIIGHLRTLAGCMSMTSTRLITTSMLLDTSLPLNRGLLKTRICLTLICITIKINFLRPLHLLCARGPRLILYLLYITLL